ncbi:MAG: HD domain-containing protein [Candidatus Kerfeldbacteria bacterium]|nr:HD domain-containing protein [Candidatus Kerfeldbacteria bacterium]
MKFLLPQYVEQALTQLHDAGFDAYVVGGSVRDLVLGRTPTDFDMTTNATPEQIQKTFADTLYNNNFGTVVVRMPGEQGMRHEIEITPYRAEAEYSDQRHPDSVKFGVSLEEDLKRRDFTINAMAFNGNKIVDLFGGQEDCQRKLIRTVGKPEERFNEDALRMLRATRFAAQLDFHIEDETFTAIQHLGKNILRVSGERIRDELLKTLNAEDPYRGFWLMHTSGLLQHILPELEEGSGVGQNKHHIYTVLTHNLFSMQFCPSDDPLVLFAALLHDVGKPRVKEGDGPNSSFHAHEHVGGRMVRKMMERLKFSRKDCDRIAHLVSQHMFYYNTGEITDAGVRRLIKRIGRENLDDLMAIRIGDRMGSGTQKEKPYKLIELERRIRMVEKDPMDTTMLKIDGNDIMRITGLTPGRGVGEIMKALLEDVLEDPSLNTEEYLTKRAQEISASTSLSVTKDK